MRVKKVIRRLTGINNVLSFNPKAAIVIDEQEYEISGIYMDHGRLVIRAGEEIEHVDHVSLGSELAFYGGEGRKWVLDTDKCKWVLKDG